jgi:naphthoate synthase
MNTMEWITAKEYEDITYKKCNGVARIAFNRPEVRNAFRPKTTAELYDAFYNAQEDTSIGVVLLSEKGLLPKTAAGHFAREEISGPVEIRAMWVRMAITD